MRYDPSRAPNPRNWLKTDEDERRLAIQRWLAKLTGAEMDSCLREAIAILTIENQLAMNDPLVVRATLERLLDGGVDRTTAILNLGERMDDAMRRIVEQDVPHDVEAFAQALEALDPAEILRHEDEDPDLPEDLDDVPEFNPEHRQALIDFAARHPDGQVMSWPETAGFLLAVTACPEPILPSDWTVVVQGEAAFNDLDEARAVTEARMALINWISDCIDAGQPAMPEDCRPDPEPMRILEADNDFSRWCRGVTAGHAWLEHPWNAAIEEDSDDDRALGASLVMLAFFGGRETAEAIVAETNQHAESEVTLEETASMFHPMLEEGVRQYALIGLEYRHMTPSERSRRLQPARSEKVGRNQPCPCGSGRKYKKCCGAPRAVH